MMKKTIRSRTDTPLGIWVDDLAIAYRIIDQGRQVGIYLDCTLREPHDAPRGYYFSLLTHGKPGGKAMNVARWFLRGGLSVLCDRPDSCNCYEGITPN